MHIGHLQWHAMYISRSTGSSMQIDYAGWRSTTSYSVTVYRSYLPLSTYSPRLQTRVACMVMRLYGVGSVEIGIFSVLQHSTDQYGKYHIRLLKSQILTVNARVVILVTTAIYVRAGREIYTKRKSLRNFDAPPLDPLPLLSDPFTSIKVTEVHVTSEAAVYPASSDSIDLVQIQQPPNAYTVTVSTSSAPFEQPIQDLSEDRRFTYTEKDLNRKNTTASRPSNTGSSPIVPLSAYMPNSDRSRMYPIRRHAAQQADNAAWSYTKVSVLFFIAMMITWIPSSANRLYSVVHPGEMSLGLGYAAAFVLPLQGFWNALIYTTTSLQGCRAVWDRVIYRKRSSVHGTLGGSDGRENRSNKMYAETDSMTELQCSRPNTRSSSEQ